MRHTKINSPQKANTDHCHAESALLGTTESKTMIHSITLELTKTPSTGVLDAASLNAVV
jgi:hypothetical protein